VLPELHSTIQSSTEPTYTWPGRAPTIGSLRSASHPLLFSLVPRSRRLSLARSRPEGHSASPQPAATATAAARSDRWCVLLDAEHSRDHHDGPSLPAALPVLALRATARCSRPAGAHAPLCSRPMMCLLARARPPDGDQPPDLGRVRVPDGEHAARRPREARSRSLPVGSRDVCRNAGRELRLHLLGPWRQQQAVHPGQRVKGRTGLGTPRLTSSIGLARVHYSEGGHLASSIPTRYTYCSSFSTIGSVTVQRLRCPCCPFLAPHAIFLALARLPFLPMCSCRFGIGRLTQLNEKVKEAEVFGA
jgi:hypothetical protein